MTSKLVIFRAFFCSPYPTFEKNIFNKIKYGNLNLTPSLLAETFVVYTDNLC